MNELRALYGQRSDKAKRSLTAVSKLIQENIPSDASVDNKLQFMYKVSKTGDAEFVAGCQSYINSVHWQTGKGWNYLAAIIKNVGANSEAVAKNERKRIGLPPPKKELKND